MKRSKSQEINALKYLLNQYRDEVIMLRNENDELREKLFESRAKEGKGCLEKTIDSVAEIISNIGEIISKNPDLIGNLKDCCDEEDEKEDDLNVHI